MIHEACRYLVLVLLTTDPVAGWCIVGWAGVSIINMHHASPTRSPGAPNNDHPTQHPASHIIYHTQHHLYSCVYSYTSIFIHDLCGPFLHCFIEVVS